MNVGVGRAWRRDRSVLPSTIRPVSFTALVAGCWSNRFNFLPFARAFPAYPLRYFRCSR